MKLLLTSGGLRNKTITGALRDLTGKPPKEVKVASIPTAAWADRGNKDWLIRDLNQLVAEGYYVDIIDLAALPPSEIHAALQDADVIFIGGGNAFFLSYWLQKTGIFGQLPELLKTKVYVGTSAGSMIVGQSFALSSQALKQGSPFKAIDFDSLGPKGASSGKTLKLVGFIFRPHINSGSAPHAKLEVIEQKAAAVPCPVYALDDTSAVKIDGNKTEVVTEGVWRLFNA
jgi:dipeptidase E